jgi:hypothetical protein
MKRMMFAVFAGWHSKALVQNARSQAMTVRSVSQLPLQGRFPKLTGSMGRMYACVPHALSAEMD